MPGRSATNGQHASRAQVVLHGQCTCVASGSRLAIRTGQGAAATTLIEARLLRGGRKHRRRNSQGRRDPHLLTERRAGCAGCAGRAGQDCSDFLVSCCMRTMARGGMVEVQLPYNNPACLHSTSTLLHCALRTCSVVILQLPPTISERHTPAVGKPPAAAVPAAGAAAAETGAAVAAVAEWAAVAAPVSAAAVVAAAAEATRPHRAARAAG